MSESLETALEDIVWYDGHYEWLEKLADDIEKETKPAFSNPFDTDKWHTEEHCIYMLLVGMFGDWGTSIRSGWIDQKEECVKYIRELCKKARGDTDG